MSETKTICPTCGAENEAVDFLNWVSENYMKSSYSNLYVLSSQIQEPQKNWDIQSTKSLYKIFKQSKQK
jgi:hypothetical protein